MWIENQRVFPNKLNKLLLKSGYALYWVLSYLFNPHNHNKSNINYFKKGSSSPYLRWRVSIEYAIKL